MDFVSLDVETANNHHRICQLGAVLVKSGQIVDGFDSLVNPIVKIEYPQKKIHNISDEMVQNKPTFPQLLKMLPDWIFQYPIVAHNASTEYFALATEFMLYHLKMPALTFYCTYKTAQSIPKIPKDLEKLAPHFGIPLKRHHDARCDAEATAQIALRFLSTGKLLARYTPDAAVSLVDKRWEGFQKISGSQFFPDPRFMWIKPGSRAAESYLMHNDYKQLEKQNTDYYRIPDCDFWEGEVVFQGKSFFLSGLFPPYIPDVMEIEISLRGGAVLKNSAAEADYVVVGAEEVAKPDEYKERMKAEAAVAMGAKHKLLQGKRFMEMLGI